MSRYLSIKTRAFAVTVFALIISTLQVPYAAQADGAALNPTFGTVTQTADGFTVPITNYDSSYTWDTPTVTSGSVAITSSGGWSSNADSSPSANWNVIASSSDGTKLAAVAPGQRIHTSTDSGATWTAQLNSGTFTWYSIASSSDGTKLAAVASGGYIYTSTDSGVNWTARATDAGRVWRSIASSSDGQKLVAVVNLGSIWTSTDYGVSWSEVADTSGRQWFAVTSSSNGTNLAAAVGGGDNGYIYTSTNSGATWTERRTNLLRNWFSIASSSDGTKIAAVASNYIAISTDTGANWEANVKTGMSGANDFRSIALSSDGAKIAVVASANNPDPGYIHTSVDSGANWVSTNMGTSTRRWRAIASSSDGTKLAAGGLGARIWTYGNRVLTVTGLSTGDSATITQTTSRSGYSNGSNAVVGSAITGAALNPTFGSPTATADGFYVTITNYDASYTWDTPTVNSGLVAITSTDGANRVLTVTGLSPGDSATITQATRRSGYSNGSNTIAGSAITGAALNPTFGSPTATADGFYVSITNYDASYTWDTPTVTSGSVAVTSTVDSIRVLTVIGLSPSDSATITQTTRRSGYSNGTNAVAGTALTGAALNPTFGSVTRTADGFYVTITNYDANYTWDTPTVTAPGAVAITSTVGSNRVLTVTGLSPTDSATITQATRRSGYSNGSNTVAGTALSAALNPSFGSVTRKTGGFSVAITNFDSNYTWDTPTVTSGSIAASTENTGDVWSAQTNSTNQNWRSIASSSDGTKLAAVVYGGSIWTSSNSGASWNEQPNSGISNWISIASSSDGTKLAAAVQGGYIYTSSDSGATWSEKRNSKTRDWKMVTSSSDGSKLAAVEADGRLNTSSDYGNTWTRSAGPNRNWAAITSSSDGQKLAAVVSGGYIYTSTDSGATWTTQTNAGSRDWRSITSSSDGSKLAAVAYGGYIYTSSDSGATWTARWQGYGKYWFSIASSSDGTKLAAAVTSGYLYTSTDSGATWTEQTNSGSRAWFSIVSSSDGSKYAATVENDKLYTFTFRGLTVTGLSDGDTATITQTTSRSNYASGSSTVSGTALSPLNPTFGPVTRFAGGFSVSITNYDANYTWGIPTYTAGRLTIDTNEATRVFTVYGLSAGDSATITQTTSRTNYPSGSNIVIGFALSAALNPTFDTITATADGFSVSITNYDADFTWDTPTVSAGSVAITSTNGLIRVLTVTGLSANGSTTITQRTSRSEYLSGSNTVTSNTIKLVLNPIFGTVTRTATGFTVPITNYDADFTWDIPTVSKGTVSVSAPDSSANWTEQRGSGSREWEFITSSSDGTKLAAVVKDGHIYTSTNSGTTWTERLTSAGAQPWRYIASNSVGTKLVASVYGGNIWTSTDSGVNWIERTSAGPQNWRGLASSSDGTKLVAVVNDGYIWTSDDSGVNWTPRNQSAGQRDWRGVATSSDGTKLAAADRGKLIYTSTDSGLTWTAQGSAGSRNWTSIASSSDGTKLAAADRGGFIYTSADSGATWTERATSLGAQSWRTITSSSDGTKLAAVAINNFIYTSSDSGVTWTSVSISGSPVLTDITSNSDGTKLAVTVFGGGYIYTYSPRMLTVTGLAALETATITQSTSRISYPNGSESVIGTALNAALNPIFDTATATTDGFIIAITNYDANYTWDTPTVSRGFVAVTSTDGSTMVLTVTGLSAGDSATVSQVTSRETYANGLSSATGRTLITITTTNISITAPVTGATPVTSTSGVQYNTTITWSESPARFAGTKRYTATVTVIPNAGYMLNGVAANLFRVNSDTATTGNLVNAGVFTYRFAATGAKLAQSITFTQPTDMSLTSDTKTLTATSSATGSYPVSFASLTTNTCTIESGAIRVVAAGICSVRATQAGDGIYSAANGVTRSIGITNNKLSQSITFTQPAAMNTRSSSQALTATSSAGNSYPVTLTSNSPLICSISSRAIVVVKFGTCSITASQAGSGTYQPANSVTRSIAISKVAQTITFSQPNGMILGDLPQRLSATTSAIGLSVTISTASPCLIDEGDLAAQTAGTCIITASQAGDDTYTAATSVTRSVVISKLTQSITFEQPNVMTVGDADQLLGATSSAGGSYPVTYASANNAICSIVGSSPTFSIRVIAPGTCSITASQVGNGTYAPAAAVVKTFVIPKLTQTITFNAIPAMIVTSGDQVLSATSSAGGSLAVRFTSTTPAVCRIINGNTLQAVSVGSCSITASQAGNSTYSAAKNVIKSFVLASAKRR